MQAPSSNNITLGFGKIPGYSLNNGNHLGVDWAPSPDPYIYAPEDAKVTFYGNAGTCGNNLQLTGSTGVVGVCHLAESYVKSGDEVKRGQKVAKMGYTGYVEPAGPAGTHGHVVLKIGNDYVDIRRYINQSFIKIEENEEEDMTITEPIFRRLWSLVGLDIGPEARQPTTKEINEANGRDADEFLDYWLNTEPLKKQREKAALYNVIVKDFQDKINKLQQSEGDNKSQKILTDLQQVVDKYK